MANAKGYMVVLKGRESAIYPLPVTPKDVEPEHFAALGVSLEDDVHLPWTIAEAKAIFKAHLTQEITAHQQEISAVKALLSELAKKKGSDFEAPDPLATDLTTSVEEPALPEDVEEEIRPAVRPGTNAQVPAPTG